MCPGFCALKRPQRNHRTPAGIGARSGRIYNPPLRENRSGSVGRGAHTPPNQAAGTTGLRSSEPGHGGMRACRPTPTAVIRVHAPGWQADAPLLRTRPRSSRRGRCQHRPASRRVQSTSPTAKAPSLPLVTKGRWHGEAVTEGIRTGSDRGLTIPQSRCA